MKKEYALLSHDLLEVKAGKIVKVPQDFEVEVMARQGNYAMVRRKGCMPFVVIAKKLAPLPAVSLTQA